MIWREHGKTENLPTPSTYSADIEDTDKDSYSSAVDGSLIDNPIAVRTFKTIYVVGFKFRRRSGKSYSKNLQKSLDTRYKNTSSRRWIFRKCKI